MLTSDRLPRVREDPAVAGPSRLEPSEIFPIPSSGNWAASASSYFGVLPSNVARGWLAGVLRPAQNILPLEAEADSLGVSHPFPRPGRAETSATADYF